MKKNKKHIVLSLLVYLMLGLCLNSCKKYLELPSDKKQVVPSTIGDCQALLDDYNIMNSGYPNVSEGAADNYYLLGSTWQALQSKEDRDNYIWASEGKKLLSQWLNPYKVAYNANLVIETINDMSPNKAEESTRNNLRGAALFYRAYAFHQLATIFSPPFKAETADQSPGIPIRLTSDLAFKSVRGTVRQTYDRITRDLSDAANLLPLTNQLPTRPTKAAAYGALARVYLSMGDYVNAGKMAEECLRLNSILIDYNTINLNGSAPIKQFNTEVLFHSISLSSGLLGTSTAKVDTVLYRLYDPNDLRKTAFFRRNSDGSYAFKGNYNGAFSAILFNGIATDEIYLIQAECFARAGNTIKAMEVLNALMKNRWNQNVPYPTISASDPTDALDKVLTERRKELIFRNIRWSDLRRLNNEDRYKTALKRVLIVNGVESIYNLLPNDLRYTLLIPDDVINNSDMAQNVR